jgi:hypothetical protein
VSRRPRRSAAGTPPTAEPGASAGKPAEAGAEPTADELAALDRKNAEELRALRMAHDVEPPFAFRAGPTAPRRGR